MGVRVFFKSMDNEIPLGSIKEIILSSDLQSPYTAANITLEDASSLYFNTFTLGSLINIFIEQGEGGYVIPFRIVSFNKIPKKEVNGKNKIELFLLHSWFFQTNIRTQAYKGTVSEITKNLLKDEDTFNTDIYPTSDRPATRYRISETKRDFLTRISKYAINKNNPVYLFMDLKNTLHLQGISDMKSSILSRVAISAEALSQYKLSDELSSYSKFQISSHSLTSNLYEAHSSITSKFLTTNFKTTGDPLNSNTIYNYEGISPQSNLSSPKKVIYTNWNKTPFDAAAISAREAFESNLSSFYTVISFKGLCLNETVPGTLIKVLLAGNPDQNKAGTGNLGEDVYMVQKSQIILNNNSVATKLHLLPISPGI